MTEFSVDCDYCLGLGSLLSAVRPGSVTENTWRAAWKRAASTFHQIVCPSCGAAFGMQDDGITPSLGGLVQQTNISSPRIDSLTIGSGARTGGSALYINGSALDVGTLVVTFDGKPAIAVTNRSATSVRVVTPVGTYRLMSDKAELTKVTLSGKTGAFLLGESIRVAGVSLMTARFDEPGAVRAEFITSYTEALSTLVGKTVSGVTSGVTGTISAATRPMLIEGEEVCGINSGAKGALRQRADLIVNAPTRAFTAGELVKGVSSGAYVRLNTIPYSGAVDVAVSNENGQRVIGGVLKNGFTYL